MGTVTIVFAVAFVLFLVQGSQQFGGIVDYAPPTEEFTGSTTITTAGGDVCVYSHISGAIETVNSSVITTLTGIGGTCSPLLEGYLPVPVGAAIFATWFVALVTAFSLLLLYFRRAKRVIQRGRHTFPHARCCCLHLCVAALWVRLDRDIDDVSGRGGHGLVVFGR
jgi:hypothetical protein